MGTLNDIVRGFARRIGDAGGAPARAILQSSKTIFFIAMPLIAAMFFCRCTVLASAASECKFGRRQRKRP